MSGKAAQRTSTVIAMAISIGAYVSVYYFLRYFLNLDGEISGGIAGLCFGLIVHIDQALKNGTIRIWHPTWPRDVVPLEQYALSWRLMILYGTFLSLSALTSFVLLIALWGSREQAVGSEWISNVLYYGVLPIVAVVGGAMYETGSWVGTRADRLSLIVVSAIAVLSGEIFSVLIIPMMDFLWFSATATVSFGNAASFGTGVAVVVFIPMVVGLWQGRRKRMANYLDYLLSRLPHEDKRAVLSMVYESSKERPLDNVS